MRLGSYGRGRRRQLVIILYDMLKCRYKECLVFIWILVVSKQIELFYKKLSCDAIVHYANEGHAQHAHLQMEMWNCSI